MIAILMSTYNGERYLREQIDSILTQTNKDWRLYIRDDGSRDSTLEIIHEYSQLYPDKIVLTKDDLGNLGPGSSFMRLLEGVDAEYYMFCDQDDVWLPTKIEKTFFKLKSMKLVGSNQPVIVFTDLYIVDSQLNIIYKSLWDYCHRSPDNTSDLYKLIGFGSPAYGCTMMFDQSLKSYLFPYKNWKYHDHWTILIASKYANIGYLNDPLIYYRQHGDNVGGYQDSGYSLKDLFIRYLSHPMLSASDSILYLKHLKELPFKISYISIYKYKIYRYLKLLLNVCKFK